MRTLVLGVASVLWLLVGACGTDPGAELLDGSYQAFASSEGSVPDLTVSITDESVVFSAGGDDVEATLDTTGEAYPVCGTSPEDPVFAVGAAVVVGDFVYANPGLFGDCGITTPIRVTLVDRDSYDEGLGVVPFGRWVELCLVTDPDC